MILDVWMQGVTVLDNDTVWRERYTYHYTVTTRMTSALRWAAMRAILMFH